MVEAVFCFLFTTLIWLVFFPRSLGKEWAEIYSKFMEGWSSVRHMDEEHRKDN